MQDQMAHLTAEQQALLRAVGLGGVPTLRTRLAGRVGVHLQGPTAGQERLVGHEALPLGEGPLRGMPMGAALLPARLLAVLVAPPLPQVGQVLQADEAVWVG